MPGGERERAVGAIGPDSSAPLPRFALPEVVGVALSAQDVADIVQRSVVEMAEGLNCTRLVALSHAPQEGLLRGVTTVGYRDEAIRELRMPIAQFPAVERAIRTRQILVVPDAATLPERFASVFSGEIVVVPLALGERVLAALVGQVEPGVVPRSASWQARALEVAARAALVVELERVASAYQDELRLRHSTREIANAILTGAPLEQIAAMITETVALRLREERVALYIRDEAGNNLPIALRNVSAEYGQIAARFGQRSPFVSRAQSSSLPYHARNVQADPQIGEEMRAVFRREGITSLLMALLQHGDSLRGALVVYPQGERQFTPAELSVFKSFADQATLAISITQLLEQQREVAMMEERTRLAREIHDTVAQSLAGLVLQLQTAQERLSAGESATVAEMLAAGSAQAKKALEDTRRAVQGLSPASLDRLTLAQAIAEEVSRFEAQEGVATQFLLTGEEQEMNPEQRTALLRIAQEALTNARKHAQAHRVRVGLQYGAEDVTLLVEDDGVGFDMEERAAPGPQGGYGLFGMSERARLLGGEVQVDSRPQWGTRVQARLPYRPASLLPPRLGARPAESVRGGEPVPPSRTTSAGEESAKPLRVLVVDDHVVIRQGIRAMLEEAGDIAVVGEAGDGAEAVAQANALRPDVALMDLQMPGVDGLEGLRRLRLEQPELPVVILTTFQTDTAVREALGAGARGYLLKDTEPANLIAAVRAASRGESLLAPAVTERLSALAAGTAGAGEAALNEREKEVLELLAQGARNKEIAARLFITPKTVEYHLAHIFNKLGVSNRTEAVRVALARGLVSSDGRSVK
ncbi:MAG TPA: hybrid sensor histidine kinase/response regulator transcription factor [Chthonomonadaceae bacterium]|nr:hybrid sensor histidine kinase/response regulator transcription factor [Chthonomonadaceae bacterium]